MQTLKNDPGSVSGRVQDPPEEHLRKKVTLISFLCSILVIYIHAYNLSIYGIDSDSGGFARVVYCLESYWRSTLSEIPVSMFFYLSGFLFFRTYSPDKLLAKYASRAKSLLIPYLVWASADFLVMGLLSILFASRGILNMSGPPLTFRAWLQSLLFDPLGGLWFLRNLIVFVFLTPLLYFLLKDRAGLPTGALVVLLLYLNLRFSVVPTLRGLEIYSLGSWIGINHKQAALKRDRRLTAVSILVLAVWFFSAFRWNSVFTEPLMLTAIWFALDLFRLPSFPWWMHITFFTYLAHALVLEAAEKLFLLAFGRSPLAALVDFLFMPVVLFLLLAGAAFILRKRTPKLWGVLNGGR